jgi:hypothetical protein
MSFRTEYVTEMTDHERISALAWIGHRYPDVFDEMREDVEKQRSVREKPEGAAGENEGHG